MDRVIPVLVMGGEGLRAGRSRALALASDAAHGNPGGRYAVILEGGPGTFTAPAGVELVQLAAGCMCCMGQLPLRVTLARLIRTFRPARIWIEAASADHLPDLRRQLVGPGFAGAIRIEEEPSSFPSCR